MKISIKAAIILGLCITGVIRVYGQKRYRMLSYLNIPVDSSGNLPQNPYIISFKSGNRLFTVIGTQHSFNPSARMFGDIQQTFKETKPEVIVHEGPAFKKSFRDKEVAIRTSGELGLEKYLADSAGIKTISGDLPDKIEFEYLSNRFSKSAALVYFATERFIFPFRYGQYKGRVDEEYYRNFIRDYLLREKIFLDKREQTFAYYTRAYKKLTGKKFSINEIDQREFVPFLKLSKFNSITRASKEARDRYLLEIINKQLQANKRILLIFGGWHILAIEPALKQIWRDANTGGTVF